MGDLVLNGPLRWVLVLMCGLVCCWFTDAGSGEPSREAVCVGPGGGRPPQSKVSERLVRRTVTVILNDLKYE